jgi:hypothetical protein
MTNSADNPVIDRERSQMDAAQRRLQLVLEAAGASCSWEWDSAE